MDMSSFFDMPRIPMVTEVEEIVKYEPPKRISFAKLIETTEMLEGKVKKVHIGTVHGEPAWADGYMLEVAEVPEGLKKLKLYWEVRGPDDKPRDFDGLIPDLPPDAPVVTPLATIIGRTGMPDTVYLADMRTFLHQHQPEGKEITLQKKYVDYFLVRYPKAEFLMIHKSSPAVVKDKGKIVGVIMPFFMDPAIMERCRAHVWERIPPTPTPPPPPTPPGPPVGPPVAPPPTIAIAEAETRYSLRQLQQMARQAGLSPAGGKRHLIKTLMKLQALK